MKSPHRLDAVPSGLPELQVGAHLAPEDGACLMEYVSVLVGTRFSDHPSCTDPVLATAARMVNDASTDAGRPLLAPLAPSLASTSAKSAVATAALVVAAVRAADDATGRTVPRVRRHLRRAQRRLARVSGGGPFAALARRTDVLYRRGAGRHHLHAAVSGLGSLPASSRDAALRTTLEAAISVASAPVSPPRGPLLPREKTER